MDIEDAVGLADIAERLGVDRHTPRQWRLRGVMPSEAWTVSGVPVWAWADVEAWARQTGRLPEHYQPKETT